ncbi:MAG: Trm112 family protein [Verrucomicrobia bacterium]|nr:Trm112 family protein [Deltaproteobacteria bacterium]
MLSSDLLNILVCPVCKGELRLADGQQKLLCRPCGLAFPIRNDIPVMLADQAEKMP